MIGIILSIAVVLLIIVKRGSIVAGFAASANAKGNTDKAYRLYTLADKMGGMNYHSKIGYGYFLLKNAYLREARAEFVKLSMNPKLKDAQKQQVKSLLALVTWKEGQLDDAIEMLEEVMESYVTSMVYQSLGLLYIVKKDKEKALPFCLEAYEYNSDDNVIMDNLAEAYVLMGDKENALKTYEELLEREPSFPDAYYGYGLLLIQEGRRSEGLPYIEKALDKKFSFLSALPRERVEEIYYAHKKIEMEDQNNI